MGHPYAEAMTINLLFIIYSAKQARDKSSLTQYEQLPKDFCLVMREEHVNSLTLSIYLPASIFFLQKSLSDMPLKASRAVAYKCSQGMLGEPGISSALQLKRLSN